MSDSEDSDLERNSDSEWVGNTDRCESVSLYEKERIISHKWDILKEKLDVENIDCEIQHRDFDVT